MSYRDIINVHLAYLLHLGNKDTRTKPPEESAIKESIGKKLDSTAATILTLFLIIPAWTRAWCYGRIIK